MEKVRALKPHRRLPERGHRSLRWIKHLALALIFSALAWISCGQTPSLLSSSREARRVLGPAAEIPRALLDDLELSRADADWYEQRRAFWSIWSFLFQRQDSLGQIPELEHWQSWYSVDDLSRIFRRLFTTIDAAARRERKTFDATSLDAAIDWNDRAQFNEPAWDEAAFSRWLAQFSGDITRRSIPGFNKILFNRPALVSVLRDYKALFACYRALTLRDDCAPFVWLPGAAFLKTSWRRNGDGFAIDRFDTRAAALDAQFHTSAWTANGVWQPRLDEGYAMQTRTAQIFHLVGMHLMIKRPSDWVWSSIWLSQGEGSDLAVDHAPELPGYRLCSVTGFTSPLATESPDDAGSLPPAELQGVAAVLRAHSFPSWCSNPFLELGTNNQQTNCIGCHQHAGLNWSQQDLTRRLTVDLPSLQYQASRSGPSDFVWSLISGPDALFAPIADTIEYFDAYDPY